jgi:small subunit ribosomal protein S8
MTMQDPIADMFSRIWNAQARAKAEVAMPSSHKKAAIAELLHKEGYINSFRVEERDGKKMLVIELRYYNGKPVIEMIERVSRPGLRIYRPKNKLRPVVGGLGTALMSTSRGLMTDREARRQGLGGEIIGRIY